MVAKTAFSMNDINEIILTRDRDSLFREALTGRLVQHGIVVSREEKLLEIREIYNKQFAPSCNWSASRRLYELLIDLYDNIEKYCYVCEILQDNLSKETFINNLLYRIYADPDRLHKTVDNFPTYFNKLFKFVDNEVYVDCGAYNGDTVQRYIKQNQGTMYKRIYAYEAMPENYKEMQKRIFGDLKLDPQNIILKKNAVSDREKSLRFKFGRGGSAINMSGDTEVKSIALDDDIQEPITFIKMDIEGSEYDAIIGAKNHIKDSTPKLAICIYHRVNDFWRIPFLIQSINNNYKFYIRHHSPLLVDSVLYCVPK